ncbi:MAG: hypothetical protein BWY98_00569 [Tenericutes bacterium ADurb.BinA155]|nr:MAG: hypothetical protein BWY98_00569 [Tenericutes bacterium ADurb.BinA155]
MKEYAEEKNLDVPPGARVAAPADKKTGNSPYAASCDSYPSHRLMKMEIIVSGSLME